MDHMHMEIVIQAPVEHVWEFYCDTSRWSDWMPRMKSVDFSGPVDQVGTTYVASGKILSFEVKSTFTIVEVEPLKLIHERTTSQGVQDNYVRFEREGEATRLIMDSDYELPAHIPAFMTKGFFERNVRNMLEDFKVLAEETAPVPA